MSIFERVKELCDSNGISVNELAEKVGLSFNSVYRWRNQTPSIDKVEKVARYFGVSVDYLIGHEIPDGDNYIVLGKLEKMTAHDVKIVRLYNKASEDDRKVIDMILGKYEV